MTVSSCVPRFTPVESGGDGSGMGDTVITDSHIGIHGFSLWVMHKKTFRNRPEGCCCAKWMSAHQPAVRPGSTPAAAAAIMATTAKSIRDARRFPPAHIRIGYVFPLRFMGAKLTQPAAAGQALIFKHEQYGNQRPPKTRPISPAMELYNVPSPSMIRIHRALVVRRTNNCSKTKPYENVHMARKNVRPNGILTEYIERVCFLYRHGIRI